MKRVRLRFRAASPARIGGLQLQPHCNGAGFDNHLKLAFVERQNDQQRQPLRPLAFGLLTRVSTEGLLL